jgi:hypothetical protein
MQETAVVFRDLVKDIPSTTFGTFALYRYPAKFIPQVIAYALNTYATPGMTIFDPFAGYGTVGLVSKVYGHNYELWDLNPLLKTFQAISELEPSLFEAFKIGRILGEINASQKEFIPQWSNLDYWFHQDFIPFLSRVWGYYHSLDEGYCKLVLTIPLLKVTRYFSYDDSQRQKLSKSEKSRKRVKSLLACDWENRFYKMVEEDTGKILRGIEDYRSLSPRPVESTIKAGIDTMLENLEKEKDILITSPPYLQSQEYIRQAKMDLFWLGYSEKRIKELGKLEIPYRPIEPKPILSETYRQFRDSIEEDNLRSIFDRYFWGVLGSLTRLQERIGSYLLLFVGRASMRGKPVHLDTIFAEHFQALGWIHETTLVDSIVVRRMFNYSKNPATGITDIRTPTENLVVLRKP